MGKISGYDLAENPSGDDVLIGDDVDDATMSDEGTTKGFRLRDLPISDAVQAALDGKVPMTHPAAAISDAGSGAVISAAERAKLAGIEEGAQVNPPAADSQEITDGTETEPRAVSPADLKLAAQTHATPEAESIVYSASVFTKWIAQDTPVNCAWKDVDWSPTLGLFVAVGATGTGNRVMTSPDGVNWTAQASAADNDWHGVAWSAELGLFAAVAASGTGNRVMTSPDGVNWTAQASAADNNWKSIAWSAELGLFAAVATSGTGNRVMTSPDGVNWTAQASAADNNWMGIAWSPELGLFAAVATSGANQVMTSPDGVNWTARAAVSPVLKYWRAIAWSAELGLFAAVAASGDNQRVMTSPDGINWSLQACPSTEDWVGIAWSPELGLFAAVAFTGSEGNIMTSPDGINWTAQKIPSDETWRWNSVAWSPELGVFAVVSEVGYGRQAILGKRWASVLDQVDNLYDAVSALDEKLSATGRSIGVKLVTKSIYIVQPSDRVLLVDCTDAAATILFPSAGADDAQRLTIKKIDTSANAVQCTPQSNQTVEGQATSYDIANPGEFGDFIPDGVNAWHRVG